MAGWRRAQTATGADGVARTITVFVVIVSAAVFVGSARAVPSQTYTVTDIGDLHSTCHIPLDYSIYDPRMELRWGAATALNNRGQVVGWEYYYCPNDLSFSAFRWSDGKLSMLRGPLGYGAYDTWAAAINDAGDVAGWSRLDSGGQTAVWWPHDAPTVPGLPWDPLIDSVVAATDIGMLTYGGPCPYSNRGSCVTSEATNINNLGEVVGVSAPAPYEPNTMHPFYFYNGSIFDNSDGLLGGPQRTIGANAWGATVSGRTGPSSRPQWPAATTGDPTLTRDGVVTHLNDVIPSGSGLTLIDAADINDRGQIVGAAAATDCFPVRPCQPAQHPYLLTDKTAPSCTISGAGIDSQGRRYFTAVIQDSLSGLRSITAPQTRNATFSAPAWNAGTPREVAGRVTADDATQGSAAEFRATDIAGNVVDCDRALILVRSAGTPAPQTVSGLAASDHILHVTNGTPGLQQLAISVNGQTQRVSLNDGSTATVDISASLSPGAMNTVVFATTGKPGSSAFVVIPHAQTP